MNYRKSQCLKLFLAIIVIASFGVSNVSFGQNSSIEKQYKSIITELKKLGFEKVEKDIPSAVIYDECPNGKACYISPVIYESSDGKTRYIFFGSKFRYVDQGTGLELTVEIQSKYFDKFNIQTLSKLVDEMRLEIARQSKIFGVEIKKLNPLFVILELSDGEAVFFPLLNEIIFYKNSLSNSFAIREEVCHYIASHEINPNIPPYLAETTPPIICGQERSLAPYIVDPKYRIVSGFSKNPQDLKFYFNILLSSRKVHEMEPVGYIMADFFSEYFLTKHTPRQLLDFLKTIPEIPSNQMGLPVEEFVGLLNKFTGQNLTVEQFFEDFSNYFKEQIVAGTFLKSELAIGAKVAEEAVTTEKAVEKVGLLKRIFGGKKWGGIGSAIFIGINAYNFRNALFAPEEHPQTPPNTSVIMPPQNPRTFSEALNVSGIYTSPANRRIPPLTLEEIRKINKSFYKNYNDQSKTFNWNNAFYSLNPNNALRYFNKQTKEFNTIVNLSPQESYIQELLQKEAFMKECSKLFERDKCYQLYLSKVISQPKIPSGPIRTLEDTDSKNEAY